MTDAIIWANERRKLSDLVPWDRNPREINEDDARRLAESLADFGQIQTIAIGLGDEILDGHQRRLVWSASEEFGPDYEIDVRVASRALTEKERQKLVIYLHKGTMGDWDWDALADGFEIDDLLEWGFDEAELGLVGFDLGGDEADAPEAQIDRAAELQEKWGTTLGQVWELGDHRLAVGDCTDAAVIEAVMQGEKADAVVTDPPYGIDWDTDYTRFTTEYGTERRGFPAVVGDGRPFDPRPYLGFEHVVLLGANWYCQYIPVGTWLVWDKRHSSGAAFLSDAELAWVKGGKGVYIYTETVQGAHRKERPSHPTQKPVGLMMWAMDKAKIEGSMLVLDPFAGSGTTGVACERLGRKVRMVEISSAYCGVILERMADMGLQPKLTES